MRGASQGAGASSRKCHQAWVRRRLAAPSCSCCQGLGRDERMDLPGLWCSVPPVSQIECRSPSLARPRSRRCPGPVSRVSEPKGRRAMRRDDCHSHRSSSRGAAMRATAHWSFRQVAGRARRRSGRCRVSPARTRQQRGASCGRHRRQLHGSRSAGSAPLRGTAGPWWQLSCPARKLHFSTR